MSSVPTGSAAPSIWAILAASRCASVTPRVRRPTKATSDAPPFFSRISWAMRVSARSSAASSRTCAFSRKRGTGVANFSPCEPLGARLKERRELTTVTLHARVRRCQPRCGSLAPRAEQIERQEREGAQHQEGTRAEHQTTDRLGAVEQARHAEEERAGPARGGRHALAENPERDPEEEQEPDGAARDRAHQSASVATTGAWSEGFVPLRSSRSISTERQRAASAGVTRIWSIRSPQPRWKAPAR